MAQDDVKAPTHKENSALARFFKNRDANRGMAPGSLVFIGEQKTEALRIRVIDYDGANLAEDELGEIRRGEE